MQRKPQTPLVAASDEARRRLIQHMTDEFFSDDIMMIVNIFKRMLAAELRRTRELPLGYCDDSGDFGSRYAMLFHHHVKIYSAQKHHDIPLSREEIYDALIKRWDEETTL